MKKHLYLSILILSTSLFSPLHAAKHSDSPKKKEPEVDEISAQLELSHIGAHASVATQTESHPLLGGYFSTKIEPVILKLISEEKKSVLGAQYRFTLYSIAQALVDRMTKKKKLEVGIMVNHDYKDDSCAALRLLLENNAKVHSVKTLPRVQKNPGRFEIMHHKFFLFSRSGGSPLLVTGSFNLTGQASGKNSENILVTDDPEAIASFKQEYAYLFQNSNPIAKSSCYGPTNRSDFARKINGIPAGIKD
jgi:phosphatidylserine/phosphatidylglycerophosphate/cardiolipin synthase-like enzyme